MKNRHFITLSLLAVINLSATTAQTTTSIKFGAIPETTQTDEYGNSYYDREATITTKNFKVENFWSKLNDSAENESSFTNISRKGTFRITTETTSACMLDKTLDEEGCSGQKPLLLNDEVLANPKSGTTDEFEVVFTEAGHFSGTDQFGFYPLDVFRDGKYYQDPTIDNPTATSRGFFGFFTSGFDFIFSKTIGFGNDFFGDPDVADVENTPRSDDAEDRRQRYIANIIAGVDKEHRMKKSVDGSVATTINAPVLNTPVSLLHYAEAQKASESESCKFMFLNLSPDGVMCSVMGGFGMNAWMPFFNQTQTTELQTSLIMGDTENSLLSMTGQIEGVPYMSDITGSDDDKLTFLQNMLKPMTTMATTMKTMWFGSNKAVTVSDPVEKVYAFTDENAMTMTFAITNDGSQVDDFANFKLMKIRSVYGDALNSCTVKKTFKFMMIRKTLWEETFVEGGDLVVEDLTSSEWVDWCQQATGSNGMFDYLFDWSSGGIFNPFNWIQSFFSIFLNFFGIDYEITDFTNKVARGLILDLKKVNVDPYSPLNRRIIDVLTIENTQE